jgi:cation:H+ antiporter
VASRFNIPTLVIGSTIGAFGTSMPEFTVNINSAINGLLIVGPGTSIPELTASIAAARRKDVGIVLSNVLGSNIFNVFFTLGVTAIIRPIPLDLALNTVVIINVAETAILVVYVGLSKSRTLGRGMGALLLAIDAGYIVNSLMS